MRQIHFHFRFLPTLFSVFFCVVFLYLGYWQLQRYHYKIALMQSYQQAEHSPAVPLSALSQAGDVRFKPIQVLGQYHNQYTILLQNQFNHDIVGFDVLTAFLPKSGGRWILVDRGWMPGLLNSSLGNPTKVLPATTASQSIIGNIKTNDQYVFTLGPNILSNNWPLVAQKIDIMEFEKLSGKHFYPFILRLKSDQKNGFRRDWAPVNMLPQRHMGYAVQWFSMALVLLIKIIATDQANKKDPTTKAP